MSKIRNVFSLLVTLLVSLFPNGFDTAQSDDNPEIVKVVNEFDQPFLFSYMSWEGKANVADGVAEIRGTSRGGAGLNQTLDLSPFGESSPALLLRVGAANQMKAIRWMIVDPEGKQSFWNFELNGPQNEWRWVTPVDGASVNNPNADNPDNPGKANLKDISQWQLSGDWNGDVLAEIQIDRIALIKPTQTNLEQREIRTSQIAEAERTTKQNQQALIDQYSSINSRSPRLIHTSVLAHNILCLEIEAGKLIPARLETYKPLPDDQLEENVEYGETIITLSRQGKAIGWLVGRNREWLATHENIEGDPLLDFVADQTETFKVISSDDADFSQPVSPLAVYRKTKPSAWASGSNEIAQHHCVFLKLPKPLKNGKSYRVEAGKLNLQPMEGPFQYRVGTVRSPAVHVHQIGFRPDDPHKCAFVSCWMGTGGGLELNQSLKFAILDDATGTKVHEGVGKVDFPASRKEAMSRSVNFNQTDVARLDFSAFKKPGRYRIAVDGFGCSWPFEIGGEMWTRAFHTQMKGLYHNRSGMALSQPDADFDKPRDMHPEDGYTTRFTTYRGVEGGGEAWEKIVAGDTGKAAPLAWGGYHDAGDWNPRRVTHMQVTMAMLEMYQQFPEHFGKLKWIGKKETSLPDILEEAIWEFSCFRRLQYDNGGIGYGIESKGDPVKGEVSWLNSFTSYVFAPDYDASWYYAAVGARLSRLLKPFDKGLAEDYLDSARRAFAFGDEDFARDKAAGQTASREYTWQSIDRRNLAALELYHTTGDKSYHEKFLQDSALTNSNASINQWGVHVQRDHAFAYLGLPNELADPKIKEQARKKILELAELAIAYGDDNAFGLTTPDRSKPQFIGFYSTPDAADLTRAHSLTGDARFLTAALRATQFQAGCNPNNFVYMTGLGANPLRNIFKVDARQTGQTVPAGLVPYGNIDLAKWNDQGITWPVTWHLGAKSHPNLYSWPTTEAYLDLGRWPMLEEFTVDTWTPNVLVWGYLSARD